MNHQVYIISKNGKPLMPTKRFGHVKRLLKSKKARVIRSKPFTIQLLYDTSEYVQELTLGLDPGHTIGSVVRNEKGEVVFAAEAELRSKEVAENMAKRKMHRRGRRRHRRLKRQRRATKQKKCFGEKEYKIRGMETLLICKVIKPGKIKFEHRKREKGWLTPTANHLLQSHINFVRWIMKLLPISKVHLEYASFDLQKLENSEIKGKEYQQGRLLGYINASEYVLCRDRHTCQLCKKQGKLEVHHVIWREHGGSNTVDNLITLCKKCHRKVHKKSDIDAEVKEKFQGMKKKYVHTTLLNSIMPALYEWLKETFGKITKNYGYETKDKRRKYSLAKEHFIDAYLISMNEAKIETKNIEEIIVHQFRQFRRHNRQLIHARRDRNYKDGKKIVAKNRKQRCGQTSDSLAEVRKQKGEKYINQLRVYPGIKLVRSKEEKFFPGDTVLVKSKRHVVKGTGNKGYTIFLVNQKGYVLAKNCQLLAGNTGFVCL